MDDQYVVVEGNFMDGFTITGPFHDIEAAQMWGEYCSENEWWFASLITPKYDGSNAGANRGGYYWSEEAKAILEKEVD